MKVNQEENVPVALNLIAAIVVALFTYILNTGEWSLGSPVPAPVGLLTVAGSVLVLLLLIRAGVLFRQPEFLTHANVGLWLAGALMVAVLTYTAGVALANSALVEGTLARTLILSRMTEASFVAGLLMATYGILSATRLQWERLQQSRGATTYEEVSDTASMVWQLGLLSLVARVLLDRGGVLSVVWEADGQALAIAMYVITVGLLVSTLISAFLRHKFRFALSHFAGGVSMAVGAWFGVSGIVLLVTSLSNLSSGWLPFLSHAEGLRVALAAYFAVRAVIWIAAVATPDKRAGIWVGGGPDGLVSIARKTAILYAAVFLILSPSGVLSLWIGIDAGGFEIPAYGAVALMALADLSKHLALGISTRLLSVILSYGAWAALSLIFFESLPRLTQELIILDGTEAASIAFAFVSHASGVGPWVMILITGLGVARASEIWTSRRRQGDLTDTRPPLQSLAVYGLFAVAAYLTVHPLGLFSQGIGTDLGQLQIPIYVFLAARLMANLIAYYGGSSWADGLSVIVRGISWATVSLTLLYGYEPLAEATTESGRSFEFISSLSDYSPLAVAFAPIVAAYIIGRAALRGAVIAAAPALRTIDSVDLGEWGSLLVKPLGRAVMVAMVVYLVFEERALLDTMIGVHLPGLTNSLYLGSGTLVIAAILSVVRRGAAAQIGSFVHHLAWAVFTYTLISALPDAAIQLSAVSGLPVAGDHGMPYLFAAGRLAPWAAALIVIRGVYSSGILTGLSGLGREMEAVVKASSAFAIGLTGWGALDSISTLGVGYSVVGALVFGAGAAVAIGHIASLWSSHSDITVASVGRWLSASAFRNATLGGAIAAYATVLRPNLALAMSQAPILELLVIAAFAAYIALKTGQHSASRSVVVAVVGSGWTKHGQQIKAIDDPRLTQLVKLQEDFRNRGQDTVLLSRSVTALWEARYSVDTIAELVSPLMRSTWHFEGSRRRSIFSRISPVNSAGKITDRRRAEAHEILAERLAGALERRPDRPLAQVAPTERDWERAGSRFMELRDKTLLLVTALIKEWLSESGKRSFSSLVEMIYSFQDRAIRWYHIPKFRRRIKRQNREKASAFVQQLRGVLTYAE